MSCSVDAIGETSGFLTLVRIDQQHFYTESRTRVKHKPRVWQNNFTYIGMLHFNASLRWAMPQKFDTTPSARCPHARPRRHDAVFSTGCVVDAAIRRPACGGPARRIHIVPDTDRLVPAQS
jgi:hypothetical protein